MEGSHRQLRTGFTDRLRRHDAHGFPDDRRTAGGKVSAVALRADTLVAFTGQVAADRNAHHAEVFNLLRDGVADHLILFDHDFTRFRMNDRPRRVTPFNSIGKALNHTLGFTANHDR